MICPVCKKFYEGNECPRCEFPSVQIPGNYEEGMRKLKPTIDAAWKEFTEKLEVGIIGYKWTDQNGTYVLGEEPEVPFGYASTLVGRRAWIRQKFARVPEEDIYQIRVYVKYGGQTEKKTVLVNNLKEAELQQIGIELDRDMKACILLKNDTGKPQKSQPVALLDS